MGRRRFAPLIALVVLGAFVLIARLFTVQVLEKRIWTAQADALVREGSVVPYTRGEIQDCNGRVLARDVESYRIDANYRDFRRGNALGIVAHARSALEMRPVTLAQTRDRLSEWAIALGRLSPNDLELFQHGGKLDCLAVHIAATRQPQEEARAGRALDLSFYATALFDLQSSERSKLKHLEDEQRTVAFVDWIAGVRGQTREAVERTLAARCQNDLEFLGDFAQLWSKDAQLGVAAPIDGVLCELERWRADVEDGAAGDMFEAAAGFPAGRIESTSLYEFFDLDWIRRCLRWDEARLAAWTCSARMDWLELRDGPVLEFAVERARRDASHVAHAELVLREVAPLFVARSREQGGVRAAETNWFESGPPVVLGELNTLFDADLPKRLCAAPNLPIFDKSFENLVTHDPGDAGVLAQAEFWRTDGTLADGVLLENAAAAWSARFDDRLNPDELRCGFEALFVRLEDAFQAELRARLTLARELVRADRPCEKLPMAKARLEQAEERVRYILKDRGSRHFVAVSRPSFALVNLLTRDPQHLRGFEVERLHLRVNPTRDDQDRPVARLLVGLLTPPSVARQLSQTEQERQIALFEKHAESGEQSQLMLAQLRSALDRPDEEVGAFGLERMFEQELAGRNGYRESHGLSDREADTRGSGADKVDGRALKSTLDATLQQAAEHCLEYPEPDGNNPSLSDQYWLEHPTGAIVLLSPDGDVIVAASVPLVARPTEPPHSPTGDDVRERTLSQPDFQPPGSVFKPFVAAFALDHLGLDLREVRDCSAAANPGGGGAGYGGVHCHEIGSAGHGALNLRRALTVSCNSYFAWVGEKYDNDSLLAMAHEFGFGTPTGVLAFGDGARSGLHEDFIGDLFQRKTAKGQLKLLKGRELCEAGNGLSVVEATPMQVARATAGLATGFLPELRLVSRIGGMELERHGRALTISKASLDIVRSAMLAVTQDSEGTAHPALSRNDLGYLMAAKTGSADLSSKAVEGTNRVRKHTWVAGWFPAENPIGILVVFEHDTTRTSNYGAIWLARQFLKQPAVSAWVTRQISSR